MQITVPGYFFRAALRIACRRGRECTYDGYPIVSVLLINNATLHALTECPWIRFAFHRLVSCGRLQRQESREQSAAMTYQAWASPRSL